MSDTNLSSFIWSVADLLRGAYKRSEYGKVILPFTVLRRLDCVLEKTRPGTGEDVTRDGVPISLVLPNAASGYGTITVERPERAAGGAIVLGAKGKAKGKPVSDATLRDTENVPLSEDVDAYFEREVHPHAPDAWIDRDKTRIGYEIPFNRHFYVFKPPRPLAEIDAELKGVTDRIPSMIGGLTA